MFLLVRFGLSYIEINPLFTGERQMGTGNRNQPTTIRRYFGYWAVLTCQYGETQQRRNRMILREIETRQIASKGVLGLLG